MQARLRLGVIPDSDRGHAAAERFAAAASAALSVPVEVQRAIDYRVLLASMEQGRCDVAWLPPIAAARALRVGAVNDVAVSMRNGGTTYFSGLIALERGPIRTVADLVGVRAAWVDRESASGYLVVRAALREQGISLVRAFSEELFVRSHAEVARVVAEGRVDVGATCFNFVSGTVQIARSGYKDHGGFRDDAMRLVAHAGPIPGDVFAAHRQVSPRVVQQLQAALVDARPGSVHEAAKEAVHADGFVRPTQEHRDQLAALLAATDRPSATMPPPPLRR